MDKANVRNHLRAVEDPDLGDDVVSFGLVSTAEVDGDTIRISFTLGAPYSPVETDVGHRIHEAPAEGGLEVGLTAEVSADRNPDEEVFPNVKNIITVASGKDDVGKSTAAVGPAVGLSKLDTHVGLFDVDVYGPGVPRTVAAEGTPQAIRDQTIVPPEKYGMKLISMAFFASGDGPVIWHGPMAHQPLTQLIKDVEWGNLDYPMLDLPPGTGDTQLSIFQTLPLTGAVIVTTSQDVTLSNVDKGLQMFGKHDANVFDIVGNMSTFQCPNCGDHHNAFGADGDREFATSNDLPFLGAFPLGPATHEGGDGGRSIVLEDDDGTADALRVIAENITNMVSIAQRRSVSE